MAMEMKWWPEALQYSKMDMVPQVIIWLSGIVPFALGIIGAYDTQSRVKAIKKYAVPRWVKFVAGKDYDEALLRSYNDVVNGYHQKLCLGSMYFGTSIMVALHYCGNMGGRHWGPFVLFAVAYCLILRERLKTAMDSDEKFDATKGVLGDTFSRRFHAFYPLIDTRKDFTRTVGMTSSDVLRRKSEKLLRKHARDLVKSIILALPLLALVVLAPKIDHKDFVQGNTFAIVVGILLSQNCGPVPLLDNVQRLIAMMVLALPLKSIQSIKGSASMEQWEVEGELPKAHYNHFHSYLKPWGGYIHNKVFKKFRKDFAFSIGKSMATTVLVKASVTTFTLVMLYGRDKNEKVNTALYGTLLQLHIGYYLHALYMYLLEDQKIGFFKSRAVKRDSNVQGVLFWWGYRLVFGTVDHLMFWQPLAKLMFSPA